MLISLATGGTPLDDMGDKNEDVNDASRAEIASDIEPKEGLNESDTHPPVRSV